MLKKLFVTAAAAAAVSVPLAGVAWADAPTDPSSNGNGIGAGGVPQKVGDITTALGLNPNPGGIGPETPGATFNQAKDAYPGNTPDAYGAWIDKFVAPALGLPPVGPTPPGLGTKAVTPGCTHGETAGGLKVCP